MIQSLIKDAGDICLFLPRFHCELNLIEMLWGYRKFHAYIFLTHVISYICWLLEYHHLANGCLATAKALILQCLNSCKLIIIWKFF